MTDCGFCKSTRQRVLAWAEKVMRPFAPQRSPGDPRPERPEVVMSMPVGPIDDIPAAQDQPRVCNSTHQCYAKREMARDNPALASSLCPGCRPLPTPSRRTQAPR